MTDNDISVYYEAAIDIVGNDKTNYKAICVAFAKSDPKKFCEVAGLEPVELQVKRALQEEGKVQAIKLMRELKGTSLKQAKTAVEKLIEKETGPLWF